MLCPGIAHDCDNPGCRHGGCQGRPPQRPRQTIAVGLTAAAIAEIERLPTGAPTALAIPEIVSTRLPASATVR
jgi:hypothetical protein